MMEKDMKTCIKHFIKHTEEFEAEEDPDGCGYHREYRLIHEVQLKNKRDNIFKTDVGKLESNLKKNRYKDILPYDDHRVRLKVLEGEENSDYINATHITGLKGSGGYIASQGPLASTVNDFWRMVWEYEVEIIFMACRTVELGKIKCKQYWHDLNCSDDFGDINVFTEEEETIHSDFTRRMFKVTKSQEVRKVIQYHYSGWPDHGVPNDPAHIKGLIAQMRKERMKDKCPLLTHCSAGCGRTGAIIAIDYVWTLLEEGKFDENFNLYDLICKFREQRMSIVQTPDQYALVYKVLKSLCEEWLAKMATHTYVNVAIEEDYVNINEVRQAQEEHIYEDSELKEKDTGETCVKTQKVPDIIELPQPSANKTPSELANNASSLSSVTANNSKPESLEDGQKEVLHKTVIQIGATSSGITKAAPSSPSGKKQEVVNFISSGAGTASKAMTFPRESSPADPSSPRSRSKSTGHATSNSQGSSSSSSPASKNRLPTTPEYNSIPGFPDRLPKVKGPIIDPSQWKES